MSISVFVLLICGSVSLQAQIGSAESEVNLVLQGVSSVEIGQSSVSIPMNIPIHFLQGNSTGTLNNHISVNSTSPYSLQVRTTEGVFNLNSNLTTLPVNVVQLSVSVNTGTGITLLPPINLSNTNTDILTSSANEALQTFDAVYIIPQSETDQFLNREEGNYTTTLIYTIMPQ